MTVSAKSHETRLRRMAERQGLHLAKSRRRDPRAVDYGRYWITNPYNSNCLVFPSGVGAEWGVSLDDIEDWLTTPPTEHS